MKQKFLIFTIISSFFLTFAIFSIAIAAAPVPSGLAPTCEGTACGFTDFIDLINRIINWLIFIAIPVSSLAFMYAGFLLLTSGDNAGKRKEAKSIFLDTVVGFIIMLVAYLVVKQILRSIAPDLLLPGFLS